VRGTGHPRSLLGQLIGFSSILVIASGLSHASDDLTRRLAEIEERCEPECGDAAGAADLPQRLGDLMEQVRRTPGFAAGGSERVAALNRFVFDGLGIRATQDLRDPRNLLLSSVLARRRGYCVGIAALYLALAERLGLPIHAVATPAHVFLRYDDGATRINIETFQRGAHEPDEQYVREHRIPERSVRRGVFLRSLTTDEFLAQVHNNLGVIYSERRLYGRAAAEYEEATRLDRRLPAAWYNHGNDLLLQGEHRRAVRLFSKALRLYPTDVWALNNRGLARLEMDKPEKARRDFEAALRIEPGFESARRNLKQIPGAP
jgi:regulator of sirC expression with transglutaminase-like and TPR domain